MPYTARYSYKLKKHKSAISHERYQPFKQKPQTATNTRQQHKTDHTKQRDRARLTAMRPASLVACLCESLKYAGTVTTAFPTGRPKKLSAVSFIFVRTIEPTYQTRSKKIYGGGGA